MYLEEEITSVDPRFIVLLGGTALKLLTGLNGIGRHESMEVETIYEGARTYAAYHPAYVLRSPSAEARLGQALYIVATDAGMKQEPK